MVWYQSLNTSLERIVGAAPISRPSTDQTREGLLRERTSLQGGMEIKDPKKSVVSLLLVCNKLVARL